MRVLVVGAGAVGISYGWYLKQGGAEVTFMVKAKYADALRQGSTVYFPRRRGVREPVRFDGYEVIAENAEVAARSWDQVWLCMSSPALRSAWLEPFLEALGRSPGGDQATLVMLQPGAEDREYLAARFPRERLVGGLITLIAYQSPLPGEAPHPDGIAVYIPPLTKFPVRGPALRARAVADAISRGGWKAKVLGELEEKGGELAGAVLQTHIVALEGAHWKFAELFRSPLRKLACAAAREGMVIFAANKGQTPPFSRVFVRPWLMGLFLRLARWKLPFDFEVYLEYHFTKVRDQTIEGLSNTIALGDRLKRPTEALGDLEAAVFKTGS
ncbi:MAG: 2-dehydropantoate 2-reductase N-terminal domain-containing protein [Myxococcota bacterium]